MNRVHLWALFLLTGCAGIHREYMPPILVLQADMPIYPYVAKEAGLAGTVQVEVTVKDGVVERTRVVDSAKPISKMFVAATLANLGTWRFPKDVDTTFLSTYIYRMDKKETFIPENPHVDMRLPTLVVLTARRTRPNPTRYDPRVTPVP